MQRDMTWTETTELSSTKGDNSTMKDRDGRTFGENLTDNEIDTTTPKEATNPKDPAETETPTESDDFDAASSKTSFNFDSII